MNVLAIDTSGANCCCAILNEEKVIANFNINIGLTHSETLLPLIDALFSISKLSLKDIDLFAVSVGPGSFTGIRIGISTIKGFALSLNKPVISVSTLESLAYNIPYFDGIVCSILDARNNNVYAAIYDISDVPKMLGDYQTDSINSLINELRKHDKKILFIGDGSISYKEILQDEFKENAFFVPYHLNEQSAVSIAKAALYKFSRNEIDSVDALHPLYLRKSQAERMMDDAKGSSN